MQRSRHAPGLAFRACSDDGKPETRPPLLVTASVDRITLARRLALDADLTMAGSVIWTGRSALDIRMQLRQVYVHLQHQKRVDIRSCALGAYAHGFEGLSTSVCSSGSCKGPAAPSAFEDTDTAAPSMSLHTAPDVPTRPVEQLRQAGLHVAVPLREMERTFPADMDVQFKTGFAWPVRQDGCPDASLTAMFTFVARDPITRKSMAVNPLQPGTPEQRRLFAERQRVADERRAARQQQPAGPASSAGEMSAGLM